MNNLSFQYIGPGSTGAFISLEWADNKDPERTRHMIQCTPVPLEIDIEKDGIWRQRRYPEEAYIEERNGIIYYIRKGGYDSDILKERVWLWGIEWKHEGYFLRSELPFSYSLEEVLKLMETVEAVMLEKG